MSNMQPNMTTGRAALLAAILIGGCADPELFELDPETLERASTVGTASLSDLELRSSGSGGSSANKSAEVACGPGQSVLGMGFRLRQGEGQVAVDTLSYVGNDITVHASELGQGTEDSWSVVAYATCATVETRGQTLFGESSTDSPRQTPPVGVPRSNPCSLNDQVLTGVGGEVRNAPAGRVVMDAMIPSADLEDATAKAKEFPGRPPDASDAWNLDVHEICSSLTGLERVDNTSRSDSDNKNVTAACPAGTSVVGFGGEIINGGGRVVIPYMLPDEALTRVNVRGAEAPGGTTASWAVRAYAICAPT